jgi:hypothetical protein
LVWSSKARLPHYYHKQLFFCHQFSYTAFSIKYKPDKKS